MMMADGAENLTSMSHSRHLQGRWVAESYRTLISALLGHQPIMGKEQSPLDSRRAVLPVH
jgi:hypothetical protein